MRRWLYLTTILIWLGGCCGPTGLPTLPPDPNYRTFKRIVLPPHQIVFHLPPWPLSAKDEKLLLHNTGPEGRRLFERLRDWYDGAVQDVIRDQGWRYESRKRFE